MARTILGICLSFAGVFGALGLAELLRRRGVGSELCRKLVHILLSNWIFIALAFFRQTWEACIVPACFVVINLISYRKGLFEAIERSQDNTPGTVWYAASLLILCLAGYGLGMPWIAACGMLAMGYGDGLAALVGMRCGSRRFPAPLSGKSLEGALTAALFSGLSAGLVSAFYRPDIALSAALSCSIPAAAVELFSPRGIDNLTLPLFVAMEVLLLAWAPSAAPLLLCLSLTLLILLAAFYLNAISFWGMQAATLLGVLLFALGGAISLAALIAFFLSGSMVSRIGKARKLAPGALHGRQGPRSVVQVAANGFPALIFAAFYFFTGTTSYLLAVLASLSAAAADTFSSEIGMLSRREPVSIVTLRKIPRGISGGVTPMGFAGAALGSLIIAPLAMSGFGPAGMGAVMLSGVAGSALDSALGAAFQAKYRRPDGGLTERGVMDGVPLELAAGIRWVNNDAVNFISPMICGSLCAVAACLAG